MAFDFKKEYKDFYCPKDVPSIIEVPKINYIAVRGKGNPNDEDGEYQTAVSILYSLAYTLKMSYKTDKKIDGFFEYVVPPLEGFWWQDGVDGIDYSDKSTFCWISVIRLPDFISKEDLEWAKAEALRKKKIDCSKAEFLTIDEGICVQIMHIGPFDDEPDTVSKMNRFIDENGYENDFSDTRLHHEIYLSDARKTEKSKWKTVIRHPIKSPDGSSFCKKVRFGSKDIRDIYIRAFPKHERMPFTLMVIMSKLWNTEFFGYYQNDTPVGFIYLAKNKSLVFIMFFAVDEKQRGKGYGSLILSDIHEKYPDKQIIVSIEPCKGITDINDIRVKRKNFYRKNRFYETGYYININNTDEEILSSDGKLDKIKLLMFFALYSNFTLWPKIWEEKA